MQEMKKPTSPTTFNNEPSICSGAAEDEILCESTGTIAIRSTHVLASFNMLAF
jgi:hypothetical protein